MYFFKKDNVSESNLSWKKFDRLLGTVLVTGLFLFFLFHPSFYRTENGIEVLRISYMVLCGAFGLLLVWKSNPLSDKWRKWIGRGLFLVTPVISFFSLEYANIMQHRILWQVISVLGEKKVLITIFALLVILLAFFAVTNSCRWSAILLSAAVCVFGMVCYFVYSLRGFPILASDLTIAGTALNVMGQYEYQLDYATFCLINTTVVWCLLINWMGKIPGIQGKKRIAAAAGIVLLCALSIKTYIYSDFLKNHKVSVNTCNPHKSYSKHGAVLTFLRSIQLMLVEKPENYSYELAQEIASAYPGDEQEKNRPNVLIIMDEAFADLQTVGELETSQDVMPFYHSLTENTIKGQMYVSSFGGKTANTEFEVLTGDSVAFLPPSSTAYQIFIKRELPNLNTDLQKRGYENTVGMHPYRPSGYNRQKVYEYFGFDQRLFEADFEGTEKIKGYVTDSADIDRVIQEYEAAKASSDAPFFIHNVTMQNHTPYIDPKGELSERITAEGYEYEDLEIYLTLLKKSDEALEKLVTYFEQQEDPTVILFFGDHQPNLNKTFYKQLMGKATEDLTDEELMNKYHTPYLIWANFDIEEKEMDISSNYLVSYMKQAAGMELTGYNQFLLELREELPVLSLNGYWDAQGNFYKLEDTESPHYEKLKKYQILQYNHLFDLKNRLEDFFD